MGAEDQAKLWEDLKHFVRDWSREEGRIVSDVWDGSRCVEETR